MSQYRVVFSRHGFIKHSCIQEARTPNEAIEFARMYSGLHKYPARAEPIIGTAQDGPDFEIMILSAQERSGRLD